MEEEEEEVEEEEVGCVLNSFMGGGSICEIKSRIIYENILKIF